MLPGTMTIRRAVQTALLGLLLAPVRPSSALAQSASERAAIERYRDSLMTTVDSVAMLQLERRMIEQAKVHRDDALLHLRLGFLSLRLGEVASHSHYDDAASEFQWAIDLQPSWPYAWFGMGLAEYGVGDSQLSIVAGLQTMMGKDALSRSAVAFAKSAEVDPAFSRGLVELANTALRQKVNIKLDVALRALRRAGATAAAANPEVLLARGRIERAIGDLDSAIVAFRGHLEKTGRHGLGVLELARTLLLAGSPDGAPLYFEGAADDDRTAVAGYRDDLVPVATDSILRELDASSGPRRAAYLARFWQQRDQIGLRKEGERLREHYRRLFYARRNFALASTNRHYDIVERYRSGSRDFDDRGIIYIRHGEPTDRAIYSAPGVEPNESWRYAHADDEMVFHFVSREDVQDYKLVESVLDILGFSNTVLLQSDTSSVRLRPMVEQLLISRERLSPIYRRLDAAGRGTIGRFQAEERQAGAETIRRGTSTDSYELEFARPLAARAEVHAVGAADAAPLVQVTYALAGKDLEPVQTERGFVYPVRLRFVAFDGQERIARAVDTTFLFLARERVPPSEHLVGRFAVPVVPGRLTYRVSLQQGEDAGVVFARDTVRVNEASGTLAISDIVLGARNARVTWQPADGDTVFFNPLRTYRRDTEMELYYELAGLAPGTRYAVELAVRKRGSGKGLFRKIFGGSGAEMSFKFEDQAAGSTARVHRALKLDRLKPGGYLLEVAVTSGGTTVRRAREFRVIDS